MEQSFNERIDQLRKKSRLLLAQVDRNSQRVKEEIKRLYSQTLGDNYYTANRSSCHRGNIKSWQLRNDSSGVGEALHLDYISDSSDHLPASMPNLSRARRVLITSKKHSEPQCCSKNVQKKPVKECYCHPEVKKVQLRSTRTQHKSDTACKYCRNHIEFKPAIIKDSLERSLINSPISCETLRRVQRIDYAPRSQFLRNVQSKVSLLDTAATGDCPDTCYRSPCYHEFIGKRKQSEITDNLTKSKSVSDNVTKLKSVSGVVTDLEFTEEEESPKTSRQSRPKYIIKRTLTSKRSVPDLSKTKSSSKTSTNGKRTIQSFAKECPCCSRNKVEQPTRIALVKEDIHSGDYEPSVYVSNLEQTERDKQHISDNELRELRKFREQNYFDTHGSSHTLHSSKSSGSLEQYLLNDRLFPEPARTIHKKDLVVTMPACATLQRKRIHYFPRYIVHQEKNNSNTNYKKKRCQTCPLTGHAIDLGVTKARPPLNSLALKYQKRLP
ncbi:hypothetical protein WN55_09106 [Dufourea novaeangliae]|uniref:Uncharacterized protein n=1 Tax=Dufourea novaeangliae TaxID=178035 RepID=A0A154P865_DUFNO|nr:hypothetical protein WN55_09106 [Dufourea novaeangliae]